MWRYDARDISEDQYRLLRWLIRRNVAEAHLIVRPQRPWPAPIAFRPRAHITIIRGDAINWSCASARLCAPKADRQSWERWITPTNNSLFGEQV